jgi:hypothetical protein
MEEYHRKPSGKPPNAGNTAVLEEDAKTLFGHIFGEAEGYLVTFTGKQARLAKLDPNARENELTATQQKSWRYPDEAERAVDYAINEARLERDAYFGVHLFSEPGNRRASNAVGTGQCLWLDEDNGHYPTSGPQATASVSSSAGRRHLYWRLTHPVSVEWAVEINRRIAAWAGGDSGKAGLASVLRVPGTSNFKRHPQVDPVTADIYEGGAWEPELMNQAIPEIPAPPPWTAQARTGTYDGPEIAIADYLPKVEVLGEVPDGLGVKYAIVCPWVNEHTGGDRTGTYIGQRSGGGLWFECKHDHCQERKWRRFRELFEPWWVKVVKKNV